MLYRFADCLFDTSLHTVQRASQNLPLAPKVFAVLLYLLDHRARVVSKDELCEQVWHGLAISDATLESCIRDVRRALGDRGQTQHIIQTQRGYGYRFVADVTLLPEAISAPAPHAIRDDSPSAPRLSLDVSMTTLPASPPTSPTPEPVGIERKPVTVLCCAVVCPGTPGAPHALETLHRLMHTLQAVVREVVPQYGGHLHTVLGDRLLLLFGIPVVREDDARRAVQAALALRQRFQGPPDGAETQTRAQGALHMGLHTGTVVVEGGQDDGVTSAIVVGEVFAVALALQEQAAPGGMLCSAATARLLRGTVRLARKLPVPRRGQLSPLTAYAILGPRTRRIPGRRSAGHRRSPFVGRQHELETLQALWAAAEVGRGQVVGIMGEAGIGKSRLITEWRRSLRPRAVTPLLGQCLSYGSTTPYGPVLSLLREVCGMTASDGAATLRAKVTRCLQALEMQPETWTPLLLSLLGGLGATESPAPLSPEARKARTLEALTQLCLQGSRQRPLLLVIEDLHWIDASSAEAITTLIEAMAASPLCLVLTYRPGYRPTWLDKSYATQMALQPLSRQDSQRVVEAVLATATQVLPRLTSVFTRADGNPFFLEELAHAVLEQGPEAIEMAVPDTVQAVLRARLDHLPATVRSLLQAAAVIGKDVSLPLWQALTEAPEAVLSRALQQLQAAEFLSAAPTRSAPVYTFKHALTHEVAYGSLLPERQRALHTRLVEILETLTPDQMVEQIERLAHHALRGEVWDKTVTYCQQAGARARDRAASREALAYFEQALQALMHLPESGDTVIRAIDLRLIVGVALTVLGEYARCLTLLGEAEVLARTRPDRARLGQVLARMTQVLRMTRDYPGAIAAGRRALALATELGESALQGQASHYLGQVYHAIGNFRQAAELLQRSVAAAERGAGAPSTGLWIESRAWLAWSLGTLGAFAEARRHGEEALRLTTLAGRGNTPIIVHGCLGALYLDHGDLEQAIWVLEQGQVLCRASGNHAWVRSIVVNLGYAYALQERLAEGHALLEETISAALRTGARQRPHWLVWLSEVCRRAGQGAAAWQHARQALVLARQQQERGNEALALSQLGTVQTHTSPLAVEQAEAYYQQAITLAEELGMRPLVAHCHLGLGQLYGRAGSCALARTTLSTAIELYRAMDMIFWLLQAERTLAQIAPGIS